MPLSFSELQARSDEVGQWLGASRPRVHTLWFGTFDEFWCDAEFRWIAHSDCQDELRAFVCLWRCYLEQVEEFELGASCLTMFLQSFLANSGYGNAAVFTPCSADEWHEEISRITRGIVDAIKDVRSGKHWACRRGVKILDVPYDVRNPNTYWGVFEDGQPVPEEIGYQRSVIGELVEAVAIRRDWNDLELFAHTTDAYVLFTWSTGA